MNEFLILSLIVSIFTFNAFCMDPMNWNPPAPRGVVFGECFFVPEMTGSALIDEANYSYRHVCWQKYLENRPQPPERERNWYFVGSLKDFGTETTSLNLRQHNYIPIEQWLIQFVFLKGKEVKFAVRSTNRELKITFQSVQQRQAFYGMVYHDVKLSKAAPNKIGMLHEITIKEDGTVGDNIKIGNNVEALCEKINGHWHITLKNEQGEPILIFSHVEAIITGMKTALINKLQLLLQAHGIFYILTFPRYGEAKKFSDALLGYLEKLCMKNLDLNLRSRFQFNEITMDS